MVLDADEWLVAGADQLGELRSTIPDFVGLVAVESETDAGAVGVSWQGRLLPSAVRYAGRIHEQPVHDLAQGRVDVHIAHDGYLAAQQERKQDRNRRLLLLAVAEDRENAYLRYQLGRDHEVAGRWPEAAVREYAAAYSLTAPTGGDPHSWQHALVTRYVWSLAECGRTQEAVDLAEVELPHWDHSADFWFGLGSVLLRHALAHPEAATGLLPKIEFWWLRCLELGDSPLPGSVVGRGSHLAAQNLVVFYESQGRGADADLSRPAALPPTPRALR